MMQPMVISGTASLPRPIRLGPWGRWRLFSQPRLVHTRFRERFGGLVAVRYRGRNHALVLSPEAVRQVLAVPPARYDAFFKESFAALLGEGSLMVLAGEAHRRERLLFAPAVHASYYRAYGDTMRELTRVHTDKWQSGQTISAVETTLPISLDVIMQLVFGLREGVLMDEGRIVLESLRRAFHPLIVFVPELRRGWFLPWRRYERARANAHEWFDRFLAWRRANGGPGDDVVARLLEARDEEGRPVNDAHIRNELAWILGAGHETTGTALAWALYEVGRHPAVADTLRAELESIGPEVDTTTIVKLPYLSAVCNETLRLHPTVAELGRVPTEQIEVLGYTIPAGHALVVSIISIHYDPGIYPEPDRFMPERFLERSYSHFEFLPYGGSHRRCLGANLADFELRIALAEIVLNWEFEPAAVDYDIRHDLAMGAKRGIPLRIKARRSTPQTADPAVSRVASVV